MNFWKYGAPWLVMAAFILGPGSRLNCAETVRVLPAGVKALEAPGIHNLFAAGTNVFSGSSPEGDEGFAALAKLGVKTIITVDGTKPDVERAHRFGMRYVHLPHGYDGIPTNVQLQLVKAAEELPSPIYVHCHHGMHRGPAAVAVICMAKDGWKKEKAEAWLKAAGTATNYAGLYDVVRNFHKPDAQQLKSISGNFPETAKVPGLVDAMVEIDNRWDDLKTVRKAGYQPPKDHPDIQPANEAVILWEHFREAQRLPDAAHRGSEFIAKLQTAESEAKEGERLLRMFEQQQKPEMRVQLDKTFEAIGKTCASCHKQYRDPSGIKEPGVTGSIYGITGVPTAR